MVFSRYNNTCFKNNIDCKNCGRPVLKHEMFLYGWYCEPCAIEKKIGDEKKRGTSNENK